jgi:hypothetical protein
MAGNEEAPNEEVSYGEVSYAAPEWDWGSDPDADLYEDPYGDTYVRWPEPEPAIRRPWHRNPVILLGLIAAASVPLSVAAVLLLTGDDAGERPLKLTPTIGTTAVAIPPSESASQTSAAETTPETSAESPTSEAESPESESPAATAESPAPLPPARGGGSDNSDGPRINVTRSPMSFTPGARS